MEFSSNSVKLPSAQSLDIPGQQKVKKKTYNSGDSLVVTHLTTNPPVHCLYMAERTGSLIFSVLWSYVQVQVVLQIIKVQRNNKGV